MRNMLYLCKVKEKDMKKATVKKAMKVVKRAQIVTPKKVAVKKLAAKKAATKVSSNRVTTISRTKALDLMQNAKGTFFTVEFIKKDGSKRMMNAQYLKDQDTSAMLGYVKTRDAQLMRTQPNDCTRNVNLQTLCSLKIKGKYYKVK